MRKTLALLLLLAACGTRPRVARVLIVGDSIAAQSSARFGGGGWGTYIGKYLPNHEVFNGAVGGKSSMSYWNDYWFGAVAVAKPHVVFLEFGHNDSKPEPERHTDPQTTYKDYLRNFINSARADKKTIVFVTPPERLEFTECTSNKRLEPYVIAMKEVALEESVQIIDLWSHSIELLESDCFTESADKIFNTPDPVHTSSYGADLYAEFIAKEYLNGSE